MIDIVNLCRHLDLLVGERVAGVIIGKHARETGEEDVARAKRVNPDATISELVEALIDGHRLAGHGLAKLTIFESDQSNRAELEIRNPVIHAPSGTGVKLVLSYWAGALGKLLNETLDVSDATYDAGGDALKCRLAVIGLPEIE